LSNIWVWSEFIILLTNDRKRAINDYIGNTVVIKAKFHNLIKVELNPLPITRPLLFELKLIGILILSVFVFSFSSLFMTNLNLLPEIPIIGITGLNIIGFQQQLPVNFLNYGLTGLLIITFSILLAKDQKWSSPSMYGAILLIIAGLSWLSLGVFPLDNDGDNTIFGLSHLIRIHICWTAAIIGIGLFLGELHLKYFSKTILLINGLVVLCMISDTLYQISFEYSGTIGAIGYFVFIIWFAAFPFLVKQKMLTSAKKA